MVVARDDDMKEYCLKIYKHVLYSVVIQLMLVLAPVCSGFFPFLWKLLLINVICYVFFRAVGLENFDGV